MGAEVNKIRDIVNPYLIGDGIDLGAGGSPVNATAISIDIKNPYKNFGAATQLTGDARDLYWFQDGVLDYVFSSHLLEDFSNTKEVLEEWLRVIKPLGIIALYLPDEQKYKKVLKDLGFGDKYNTHHKIDDMSLDYMKGVFSDLDIEIVYEYVESEDIKYGFLIVGKKNEN